jgi:hypothetical protein
MNSSIQASGHSLSKKYHWHSVVDVLPLLQYLAPFRSVICRLHGATWGGLLACTAAQTPCIADGEFAFHQRGTKLYYMQVLQLREVTVVESIAEGTDKRTNLTQSHGFNSSC